MIYKYGSYTHAQNEVQLTVNRSTILDSAGVPYRLRTVHNITGFLRDATATMATMTSLITALKAAYAVNGQNAGLYHNDGTTPSAHVLTSATCIGGTRVTALEFPSAGPGEYTTIRNYKITVEGDEVASAAQSTLEFSESLSFEGGTPKYMWSDPIEGTPELYQLTESGLYTVTQSGRAVGRSGYPVIPDPLFSGASVSCETTSTKESPKREGANYIEYAITWTHVMKSSAAMTGSPNTWIT